MKRFFFWLIYQSGICALARLLGRRRLKVVLYHGVTSFSGHLFNYRRKFINPASFERQVAFLATHYTILPLDTAVDLLRAGKLPARALCITFDDGYRNNYEYAFPVLKKYGVPATIFLATDFVFNNIPLWVDRLEYAMEAGKENLEEKMRLDDALRSDFKTRDASERLVRLAAIDKERGVALTHADAIDRYAPLTTHMLREMALSNISFGAHTKSHPILRRLPHDEARTEIVDSQTMVKEHCGTVSRIFAYPNGQHEDWTDDIERILADEGFTAALTTISGTNTVRTPRFRLRRITMDATDDWTTFIATESGIRGIVQALKSNVWRK